MAAIPTLKLAVASQGPASMPNAFAKKSKAMDIEKEAVVLIGCGDSRYLSFRTGANNSLQRP